MRIWKYFQEVVAMRLIVSELWSSLRNLAGEIGMEFQQRQVCRLYNLLMWCEAVGFFYGDMCGSRFICFVIEQANVVMWWDCGLLGVHSWGSAFNLWVAIWDGVEGLSGKLRRCLCIPISIWVACNFLLFLIWCLLPPLRNYHLKRQFVPLQTDEQPVDDLMDLVKQIVPFHVKVWWLIPHYPFPL